MTLYDLKDFADFQDFFSYSYNTGYFRFKHF